MSIQQLINKNNQIMSQMRTTALNKKGRAIDESSMGKGSESNRLRYETKKSIKLDLDEQSWMGASVSGSKANQRDHYKMETTPDVKQFELQSAFFTGTPKQSNKSSTKPPMQLIQDILKGLYQGKVTEVNPYYSEQSEQKLAQILTNKSKMQSYIQELEIEMRGADSLVVKNYEMLIILLKHLGKSDIEVKHTANGLQLGFNRNLMLQQENQIQKLEAKLKEKDENIKEIIEEYESVIRNFYDVIEKLLQDTKPNQSRQNSHLLKK